MDRQPWLEKPRNVPTPPKPEEELALATSHLADAELKLSKQGFERALKATQDAARFAARALLAKQGAEPPRTDRGLVDAFIREGVQAGLIQSDFGQTLQDILETRPFEPAIREAIKKTSLLLDRVKATIS